ncbi:MAG: hypothetical protein EA408_05415 [Marinilabiliales bacterium]|nr:MAG: hypothetical protein EA408_05415 [Marinilabiliales bacterium]
MLQAYLQQQPTGSRSNKKTIRQQMKNSDSYYLTASILALEGHENTGAKEDLEKKILSEEVDWNKMVYTASNNYVLQAIYLKMRDNGLLEHLPAGLTAHLKELHDLNLERNKTILEHTGKINRLLRSNGITPVFMKGLGNMLDGLYSTPAERMMLDIDILADPDLMEKAAQLLIDDGFTSAQQYDPARKEAMKHFPELVREGLPAFVDIHRLPVNIQYESVFGYPDAIEGVHPSRENPEFMVMSDVNKIRLNFIHSQKVHWGHQHARPSLRDLYDLLLLARRTDPGSAFDTFRHFRRQAAGYIRVLNSTFGTAFRLPEGSEGKGLLFHRRHRMAMEHPRLGKISYHLLRACRLYLAIPVRSLFDRNYRLYVRVRLRDPEWYKRNLGIRKIVKKKEPKT